MTEHEEDRMKKLLQQALPAVEAEPEPGRDLWPAVLKRMDEKPDMLPWLDWALLGGLVGLAAFFPTAIPVMLYYL
ncbi:MAG: hypothetical protein ABSF28_15915 [Terracidiphilus sp.]